MFTRNYWKLALEHSQAHDSSENNFSKPARQVGTPLDILSKAMFKHKKSLFGRSRKADPDKGGKSPQIESAGRLPNPQESGVSSLTSEPAQPEERQTSLDPPTQTSYSYAATVDLPVSDANTTAGTSLPPDDDSGSRELLIHFCCLSTLTVFVVSQATKSEAELVTAVKEFKDNYVKFTEYNKNFVAVEKDIQSAAERAQREDNVHRSASIFRHEISRVLDIRTEKEDAAKDRLISRMGHFAVKMFPVARIVLGFTQTISDVYSPIDVR